ncbi:hypothetical protein [Seonamhaeicola sp.]|uniref:hypothetical protein n=1 Tax=Seonamhaeicola sp. TaxID=1912245 RepID=UPI00262446DA|nr:hypothetical protein [Seonamhaeicola sp.]
MNSRINYIYIAISNHRVIYAESNLDSFYKGLKALHPSINSKRTIKKEIDERSLYLHVNEFGIVVEVYRYSNPDYVGNKN